MLVMVALQLLALVPVIGDLLAAAVLTTGLGAVLVTYFGFKPFTPASFSD
jgi:hypothetical protein